MFTLSNGWDIGTAFKFVRCLWTGTLIINKVTHNELVANYIILTISFNCNRKYFAAIDHSNNNKKV